MKIEAVIVVGAALASGALATVGSGADAQMRLGLKPYGDWTYVQAMDISKGKTYVSEASGTLRLFPSGAFTDKRGIGAFFPTYNAGTFKLVGDKLFVYAISKGKRVPKSDAVYTYVYNRQLLAFSLVTPTSEGGKLAFLLYYKGSEELPRCGGKELKISLKC